MARFNLTGENALPVGYDPSSVRLLQFGGASPYSTPGAAVRLMSNGKFDYTNCSASITCLSYIGIALDGFPALTSWARIACAGIVTIPSAWQVGSWAAGDQLYLDVQHHKLTNLRPTTNNYFIVPVGRVIAPGANALVLLEKGEYKPCEVWADVPIGPTTDYQPTNWYEASFFNLSANLGAGVINSFKYDAGSMLKYRKLIRNRTSNTITIKNNYGGSGNVLTKSGTDVILSNRDTFEMIYCKGENRWDEI